MDRTGSGLGLIVAGLLGVVGGLALEDEVLRLVAIIVGALAVVAGIVLFVSGLWRRAQAPGTSASTKGDESPAVAIDGDANVVSIGGTVSDDRQSKQRQRFRHDLSEADSQGALLLASKDTSPDEVQAWKRSTHDLIRAAVGDYQARRFLDNTNRMSSDYVNLRGLAGKLGGEVDFRRGRIAQLMDRIDTLAMEPDFPDVPSHP